MISMVTYGALAPLPKGPSDTYVDLLAKQESIELEEINADAIALIPEAPENHPILTKGYIANGALTVGISAAQSLFNRLLNNNSFNTPSGKDTWITMSNTSFTHLSNKVVKGNYLNVQNARQQTAVLLGYIVQAALFDCLAYTIPFPSNQTTPIGQATVLSAVNALGYLSAMGGATILGKGTYMLDNESHGPRTHMRARRVATAGLLVAIAMGASTINRTLLVPGSSFSTIISHANSETVNKLLKAAQATEEKTSQKVLLLGAFGIAAIAADVFMGFVLPSSLSLSSPSRYLGAVTTGTAIEFAKVSAKALLDHDRMPTAMLTEKQLELRALSRKIKGVVAGVFAVAMPLVAIAANHSSFATSSPTGALVVKQLQHSLTGLAAQELFKSTSGLIGRSIAIITPVAVALAGELIVNRVLGTSSFSATSVALGTAASYIGMTISSWLIGRDDEDN